MILTPTRMPILTPRWTPLKLHPAQQAYWSSPHRFNVLPCGRRSGKTEFAKRKLVLRAIRGSKFHPSRYFAAAPTNAQAEAIYWNDLKALVPERLIAEISETDTTITLITGTEIKVAGMDKPQRIEGQPWDGGILDEYADMKAKAWPAHVRPALADRKGWCELIGVPEGRNHYFDTAMKAKARMAQNGRASEWGYFTWLSADILDAAEIAAAKEDLDELTYLQEYEASFVSFTGRAYYAFDALQHVRPIAGRYNPRAPLAFMFDFNVSPGVAAVAQEMELANGNAGTGIIGEVHIPRNSNTPVVCRKLIADWGDHQGEITCYGDATGGAAGSAKVQGSDWDLIRATLGRHFGERMNYRVPTSNPAERQRVNAVNSRLKSIDGQVRMEIDGEKCPNVIKDFEGVQILKGSAGELDKKTDLTLTHITDAIGYYVHREHPLPGAGLSIVHDMRF